MARDIEIKKKVYDKSGFNKVVDRSFKSYGQVEEVKQPTTVDEFFSDYERLYYEISPDGETKSHQYLIEKSMELVDFEKDTEDIQPLLDEIAQLRGQLLEYQEQLIEANKPDIDY
jgi:hypothetical protein|tara:strand:+ start:9849 stop:10193 length:345 start_codon:yes stop_codon:yes gene_type:complete